MSSENLVAEERTYHFDSLLGGLTVKVTTWRSPVTNLSGIQMHRLVDLKWKLMLDWPNVHGLFMKPLIIPGQRPSRKPGASYLIKFLIFIMGPNYVETHTDALHDLCMFLDLNFTDFVSENEE